MYSYNNDNTTTTTTHNKKKECIDMIKRDMILNSYKIVFTSKTNLTMRMHCYNPRKDSECIARIP